MEINIELILFVLVSFVLGLMARSYLPSYMKSKAQNLATKEDIEDITTKVESVKSSIEIDKQMTVNLLTQKQQMLMNFYDEVTTFHYELLAVNFGDLPYDSGKSLYDYQTQFYKKVSDVLKYYQRLVVFLPSDSRLLSSANMLTQTVIDSRKVVKQHFGNIKSTIIDEQCALESGDKAWYRDAAQKADTANSTFWNEMKTPVEEFQSTYKDFLTELNKYYI